MSFLPGRTAVMLEITCAYRMFYSYYYSSGEKVEGHHRVAKVGETGIAGCMLLRPAGFAGCRMYLTVLLLSPESVSGPHVGRSADCSAGCSAETFVAAFVVVAVIGAWIVVAERMMASLAAAAAVAVVTW
jgi:hypothetical protein